MKEKYLQLLKPAKKKLPIFYTSAKPVLIMPPFVHPASDHADSLHLRMSGHADSVCDNNLIYYLNDIPSDL